MLIAQAGQLEQFHWFVRAHLEDPSGSLATSGARTEKAAARTRKIGPVQRPGTERAAERAEPTGRTAVGATGGPAELASDPNRHHG